MAGRYRPTRIICAMPRASSRSLLLICAASAAFIWRVSTRVTGKPASAIALYCHCDKGPATPQPDWRLQRRTRIIGWRKAGASNIIAQRLEFAPATRAAQRGFLQFRNARTWAIFMRSLYARLHRRFGAQDFRERAEAPGTWARHGFQATISNRRMANCQRACSPSVATDIGRHRGGIRWPDGGFPACTRL